MSGSFLITSDKPDLEYDLQGFMGRAMSRAEKALDKIAKKLKVTALNDFVSLDEGDQELMREMIEEGGGDASEIEITPPAWFDPADGLKTVRALRDHLINDPKAVGKSAEIVAELTELETTLTLIATKKGRFRFFIDY